MLTKEDYDIVEVIALADRPMFMDDNARPHRTRIVQHFSYSKRLFRQFHGLRCRQT